MSAATVREYRGTTLSGDFNDFVARAILILVPMILSLTVHEFAHAWSASLLGDDTAASQGRLNLNPMTHIDPIGTIGLPLLLLAFGGGLFFGWAKPVPFNPTRFTRKISMRTGTMIVAAAGPISNLLLATICTGLLAIIVHGDFSAAVPESLHRLLFQMVLINIALALFNFLPVYPLDGQKVLTGLLPGDVAIRFERFSQRYGSMLILVVFLFAGRLIGGPFSLLLGGLLSLFGLDGGNA